jgi:hypothetical protein
LVSRLMRSMISWGIILSSMLWAGLAPALPERLTQKCRGLLFAGAWCKLGARKKGPSLCVNFRLPNVLGGALVAYFFWPF